MLAWYFDVCCVMEGSIISYHDLRWIRILNIWYVTKVKQTWYITFFYLCLTSREGLLPLWNHAGYTPINNQSDGDLLCLKTVIRPGQANNIGAAFQNSEYWGPHHLKYKWFEACWHFIIVTWPCIYRLVFLRVSHDFGGKIKQDFSNKYCEQT